MFNKQLKKQTRCMLAHMSTSPDLTCKDIFTGQFIKLSFINMKNRNLQIGTKLNEEEENMWMIMELIFLVIHEYQIGPNKV